MGAINWGDNGAAQTFGIDSSTGLPVAGKSANGMGQVTVGPASQARNRNLAAVAKTYAAATNSETWGVGSLISSLEVTALLPADADEMEVINTATTRTPFTGQGKLGKVIINSMAVAATLTIYDAATATGTPISVITATVAEQANPITFDGFL